MPHAPTPSVTTPLAEQAFANSPHAKRKTYPVASYDVGPDHRATVAAVLRYLHDGAQAHAADEGFGYRELNTWGQAWALVAIDLAIDERPAGGSDLETFTTVSRAGGPLVWRDYAARAGGLTVAEGQSLWALIDLGTRSTARTPPELRAALNRIAAPLQRRVERVARVPARPTEHDHLGRVALTHDCDFNGHLNNVVAAAWILDAAYDVRSLATAVSRGTVPVARRLWLSYHHEVLRGEEVQVRFSEGEEGEVYVELQLAERGELAVNGVVWF